MASTYDVERAKYVQHLENTLDGKANVSATEIETSPLFSLQAKYVDNNEAEDEIERTASSAENMPGSEPSNFALLPQYGLLGFHTGDHPQIPQHEPIMLNTRAPNSTFICGSQGSGESYTLNCILENCLLADPQYGSNPNPVTGVAFHYDNDDADSLAEVASLCSRRIQVCVLVSTSNYHKLREAYAKLPGAAEYLTVEPLAFQDQQLNVDRMHRLMALSETDKGVPLCVEVIHRILREIAITDQKFSFDVFKAKLAQANFAAGQMTMLDMRMGLLKSFLAGHLPQNVRPTTDMFKTKPGTLTVVDLTDFFVDSATACVLFNICLGLFKQNRPYNGMVVVLDEAHKYLFKSPAADKFIDKLLTTIRMQRHQATRVVIATQEPTISERLLDLCSTSIVHRFTSPAWFAAIKDRLAAASDLIAS